MVLTYVNRNQIASLGRKTRSNGTLNDGTKVRAQKKKEKKITMLRDKERREKSIESIFQERNTFSRFALFRFRIDSLAFPFIQGTII